MTQETENKTGLISEMYKKFKESNLTTLKIAVGVYFAGFAIAVGSIGYKYGTMESYDVLKEHDRIERELNYLYDSPVNLKYLINEQYRDSLTNLVKSTELKKDSLEALPSFVQAKKASEKPDTSLPLYIAFAGSFMMAGSIPFIIRSSKKQRRANQ